MHAGHIGETPEETAVSGERGMKNSIEFLITDLTPPSCGHSLYILRCKTPCNATRHGWGEVEGQSLLAERFFAFYASVEIEEI